MSIEILLAKAYNIYMIEENNTLINIKNLSVNYFGGYKGIEAVSFNLAFNEILPIYGKNFSGKSSLLRAIATLENYSGEITFNKDIQKNMVYSFSYKSLKNSQSVEEVLSYPLKLRNIYDKNIVLNKARYYKIEHLLKRQIRSLSIEEKSIVCLCRAMIRNSELYLLDNPLEYLNSENREIYFELLKNDLLGKTAIYATNLIDEAFKLNEKVGIIAYGMLHQIGTKEDILKRPTSISVLQSFDINSFVIAQLYEKEGKCKFLINNIEYETVYPICDVYLNKEVVIPIINGEISRTIYFDKDSEYIVSGDKYV